MSSSLSEGPSRKNRITTAGTLAKVSSKAYGPGFILWVVWSYLAFLLANVILLHRILTMPRHLRDMSGPIVLAVAVLFTSHVLYLSGHNPIPPYDPTPLSLWFRAALSDIG